MTVNENTVYNVNEKYGLPTYYLPGSGFIAQNHWKKFFVLFCIHFTTLNLKKYLFHYEFIY